MKERNVRGQKRQKRSFNPKLISIGLADALKRDLASGEHVCHVTPVASVFRDAQNGKFLSKFSLSDEDAKTLEKEAFDKFYQVNEHMGRINEHFATHYDDPVACFEASSYASRDILMRARELCYFVLGQFDEDEFFEGCKSSGGTSIGVPYSNTSPERKYTYPLSVSDKKLIPLWDRYCLFDKEFAKAVTSLNHNSPIGDRFSVVGMSRATTVEKSTDSRRMIAVEPVVNMFFQQGLKYSLTRRLLNVGIDLTRVPFEHRRMAYESSITASLDTVDFSSASDCVSLEMLRWLLPPAWFFVINLVRSPSMLIDGNSIELNMISTMGNATTFPIETLVFWSIAVSTVMTVDEPDSFCMLPNQKYFRSVSVFGDDCILPARATADFIAATETVGFIVNKDKSFFNGGYFRESCGGDYYRGCNVRPVYLRAPANSKFSSLEPWLYTTMNKIFQKYISYFGSTSYVYSKEFFEYCFAIFKKERLLVKVVPDWYPEDSGLRIGDELHRFQSAYDIPLSRISRSDQGLWRFNFCKFNYKHKENWHEHLRYSLLLKSRMTPKDDLGWFEGFDILKDIELRRGLTDLEYLRIRRELSHDYSIRKLGGYVVATGYTPTWSPNYQPHG